MRSVARMLSPVVVGTLLAAGLLLAPPAGATPVATAEPAAVQMPSVAAAASSFDATMIALLNRARAAAGVGGLSEAVGLDQVAHSWSGKLNTGATGFALAHDTRAFTEVAQYGAANRTSWGENVAWSSSTATTAQSIFNAYMNSPGHRANILNPAFHYVGMGTAFGTHGLWNTTEFTDRVEAGQSVLRSAVGATRPWVTDGQFIRDAGSGAVYRIAGGAPVYVSTWKVFGREYPCTPLSAAQIALLPGKPRDGTFLRATSGAVYRMAGGAPIYVHSWAVFGGVQPAVGIDPAAITRAGSGGVWNHLTRYPADNTFLRALPGQRIYRVVSGHPTYLTSWALMGGPHPVVQVDGLAIAAHGHIGVWSQLK